MVKILLDPSMYHPHLSVAEECFKAADLGYERGNAVSSFVNRLDEAPMTEQYLHLFDQIWNNPQQVSDVTQAVHDHIASVYAENSPARIYFLILYNLFAEFLDYINEDVLPNDRTGYPETKVWQSLYNFQRDAATGIINKLETYNGCILADSVGLGKTFTALAVIKYYELRNKSVLVLCPKKLAENWTNYNANLTTNIFASDRFNYDVLAHTDLSRTKGESLGLRLDRINWGNYDLVVIDGAGGGHHEGVGGVGAPVVLPHGVARHGGDGLVGAADGAAQRRVLAEGGAGEGLLGNVGRIVGGVGQL